jgi:lipopolysaccharide transport system ATP-binding protein
MAEPIIAVQGLGKTYRLYSRPWHRLHELATRRPRHQPFHALREVSFEVAPGESLGIIGENGAGKSTLLKILSGVTVPSRGELAVRGKVASLLELGMGFHPEFTGRQNIRLNAAMIGLTPDETERKIPDIIAFSELGDFVDRQVKTYSTGMMMRLGFAIAVQVEPDILIIDEALSVGDGYFQKKCVDRLGQLADRGCTLLFCSHAMYYVSHFCQRALWLKRGEPELLGPVQEVVRSYESFLLTKGREREAAFAETGPASGEVARITGLSVVGTQGGQDAFRHGDSWALQVSWRTVDASLRFHLGVAIDRNDGVQVCSFSTHRDGREPLTGRSEYRMRLEVPRLPLVKGDFDVWVVILDEAGLHVFDQRHDPAAFRIRGDSYAVGLMEVEHQWHGEQRAAAAVPGSRLPS